MRIVSQSGKTDLPYEKVGVSVNAHDNCMIIAYGIEGNEDNYWEMARYSTAEKAQKAMEMLRNAYSPKFEMEELKKTEIPKTEPRVGDWVWTVTEPKIEVLDNFYFQFPADSEIEV